MSKNTQINKNSLVNQVSRLEEFRDVVLILILRGEEISIKSISDLTGISKESLYRKANELK